MVKQKKSKAGRKTLASQGRADDRKLPGGMSKKIWDSLLPLLEIERMSAVIALVRYIVEIYLDERLQEQAKIQGIAPSFLLMRARDWYLNSPQFKNGRLTSENDIVVSKSE